MRKLMQTDATGVIATWQDWPDADPEDPSTDVPEGWIDVPEAEWPKLATGARWTGSAIAPKSQAVPAVLTMRQARLALAGAGKLAQVEAAIEAMPEPQKTAARITWEYSSEVQRNHPLIASLSAGLNLSSAELDALFVAGAAL